MNNYFCSFSIIVQKNHLLFMKAIVHNFLFALDYHMKTNANNYLKEQMEHLLKQFMQFIVYSRNMYWGMGRKLTTYLLLYKLYEILP